MKRRRASYKNSTRRTVKWRRARLLRCHHCLTWCRSYLWAYVQSTWISGDGHHEWFCHKNWKFGVLWMWETCICKTVQKSWIYWIRRTCYIYFQSIYTFLSPSPFCLFFFKLSSSFLPLPFSLHRSFSFFLSHLLLLS